MGEIVWWVKPIRMTSWRKPVVMVGVVVPLLSLFTTSTLLCSGIPIDCQKQKQSNIQKGKSGKQGWTNNNAMIPVWSCFGRCESYHFLVDLSLTIFLVDAIFVSLISFLIDVSLILAAFPWSKNQLEWWPPSPIWHPIFIWHPNPSFPYISYYILDMPSN